MSERVGRALGLVAVASMAACLSAPPSSAPDDGGVAPGDGSATPDASGALPQAVLGNVLFFDFNEVDDPFHAWDRSGHSRHGWLDGVPVSDCPYGDCIQLDGGDSVAVSADPGIGRGAPLTIEAWVKPTAYLDDGAAVFSNYNNNSTPVADYSFEVSSVGDLRLLTNDGGGLETLIAEEADVPLDAWTHVAMTWEGQTVRFYQGGELVGEFPLEAEPTLVDDLRFFYVGRRTGGAMELIGFIDEVKVSDWAKSQADIRQSMEFDSTALFGQCGDHIGEDDEVCDGQQLCCQPDSCSAEAADEDCSAVSGACMSGRCAIDEAARVKRELVALYEFEDDGTNTVLEDTSGGALEALDLELLLGTPIQNLGYITLDEATRFRSATTTDKILVACKASQELTVEAWLRPANTSQDGPARIVTMSSGPAVRNFTLGQAKGRWVARVSSRGTNRNGLPNSETPTGDVDTSAVQHVVLTVTDSERRMYVDGRLSSRSAIPGGFASWEADPLLIGNEEATGTVEDDRPWLGDLHLVAVYCAALTEVEIAQNYGAGADP